MSEIKIMTGGDITNQLNYEIDQDCVGIAFKKFISIESAFDAIIKEGNYGKREKRAPIKRARVVGHRTSSARGIYEITIVLTAHEEGG